MLNFLYRVRSFQRIHGTRRLLQEIVNRIRRRLVAAPGAMPDATLPGEDKSWVNLAFGDDHGWVNAREMAQKYIPSRAPLRLFLVPSGQPRRISLVTDSINKGSLYGGVGTSLIMAALVAQATQSRLRIITRTEPAQPAGLQIVLRTYGITLTHEVEFAYAPVADTSYEIDCFEGEQFITTSWWTTAATLASVRSQFVTYLLQEDERMFYAHGDEHMRCSQILGNTDIRFIINTRLLFDHLVASGLDNIATHGMWFEPSFPHAVFRPRDREAGQKRQLLFYARPHNVRNLFYFGIELLEAAIDRGIVKLDEWDIVLVGKDIPKLRFDNGRYSAKRLENLSWTEYAELAGNTDLALCLMYTPHPSYPPFDLAASGAVVVTNRFGNKQDLSGYSKNILCGDLQLESMLTTMASGVALAIDAAQRTSNFHSNLLGTDWKASFADVVQRFEGPR